MPESPGELDLLRAYLRDRDVACPVCGHNLRGAAGFARPECGGRLDLHVVSMDMPHKWWMVSLLTFALPLGLFGTLASAGIWSVANGWMNAHDKYLLGAFWAMTLLALTNLVLLGRKRTRFIQRSVLQQRVRAMASMILMTALSLVLAFVMTRSSFEYPWSLIEGVPMP